jgi:hypothetical protein
MEAATDQVLEKVLILKIESVYQRATGIYASESSKTVCPPREDITEWSIARLELSTSQRRHHK